MFSFSKEVFPILVVSLKHKEKNKPTANLLNYAFILLQDHQELPPGQQDHQDQLKVNFAEELWTVYDSSEKFSTVIFFSKNSSESIQFF